MTTRSAREHGGARTVTRFAHGGIGKADDREATQSVGDVDFDGHGAPHGAAQGGGGDRGEHAGERSGAPTIRAP